MMGQNCNDWYLGCSYNSDVNEKKYRTSQTHRGNIDTSTTATCNNNIAEQEPCQACIGCGSHQDGTPRIKYLPFNVSSMRSNVQHLCNTQPIFDSVPDKEGTVIKSFEDEEAPMNTLIAHITFNQIRGSFMSTDGNQVMEINPSIISFSPKPDARWAVNIPSNRSTTLKVFPNSGTTFYLGGPKHQLNMGLTKDNLVPSRKIIWTVGGFTLICQGWLHVEFVVRGKTTKQALYICKYIQGLYFSLASWINVGILHENFPNPFADKHY